MKFNFKFTSYFLLLLHGFRQHNYPSAEPADL